RKDESEPERVQKPGAFSMGVFVPLCILSMITRVLPPALSHQLTNCATLRRCVVRRVCETTLVIGLYSDSYRQQSRTVKSQIWGIFRNATKVLRIPSVSRLSLLLGSHLARVSHVVL